MKRRVFDPPSIFSAERLGSIVGLLALIAFAVYLSDYFLDTAGF
jgi:hypothetical protein